MRNKDPLFHFISAIFIIFLFLNISLDVIDSSFKSLIGTLVESSRTCDNISKVYSGNGFLDDVKKTEALYVSCYDNDEYITPTIDNMLDCYSQDCEDRAFFLKCLAGLYGIECNYQIQALDRHVALICLINNQWQEIP